MKLAIAFGQLNPSAWIDVAVAADELGYDSIWIAEHLVLPAGMQGSPHAGSDHPPIPADLPVFDALGYLAFLAARTERIRLGTHVFNIGLRHPFVTARAAATVDLLSGGRLDFGVGASWLREEWDAVGLDFATRGARVDEAIDVCRRLWTEPVVEHHGQFFDFAPVMFEPKPVQAGGPRLHIGGDGPAALRRAATVGDGWIPMNHSVADLPPAIERLAELREKAGRPGRTEVTLGAAVDGPDDLALLAAAGVDRVFVKPWRRTSDAIESLAKLAARCGLSEAGT
ncbi:MAG: luciferase [Acidimicrobiales bacterium]|nr:luciferase [Acidimicrobiales bacterium]